MTRLAFSAARPRAQCPHCYRSIATVSQDSIGQGRLRAHKLLGVDCEGSGVLARLNGRAEVAA